MSEHVSAVSRWGELDPNAVRQALIREMNRAGVLRLEGEYSGGHDEGGLDSLVCFDKDDKPMPELGYDHPLHQAVEDLLSTKFYSWALEWSVWGHVYADLRERRAWTQGSQEVMSTENDPDPIDMQW